MNCAFIKSNNISISILILHDNEEETMERLGDGFCQNGYYMGWDGKGVDSQDACNAVCLSEPPCKFAAWFPKKTCSRYNEEACHLNNDKNHVTYAKKSSDIAGKIKRDSVQSNICLTMY